jgi:hypothetical protein
MARGKGRRQLVGFWWVLAFMLGSIAGALSSNLIGISYTAWWIVGFCGSAAVVVALAELFGESRDNRSGTGTRWRPSAKAKLVQPVQRNSQEKGGRGRRGQLHAITGRKMADPPSSGAS